MTNQSSDKTTNSVKAFWLKTHFFIKSVHSTGTNFLMQRSPSYSSTLCMLGNFLDNLSIGHIRIRIHGKNLDFFTMLMSPVLYICIWYWDNQFWWRVNRYFRHIQVTSVCQENVEISIWHKSIWKLYWSEIVNGQKTRPRQLFLFLDTGIGITQNCPQMHCVPLSKGLPFQTERQWKVFHVQPAFGRKAAPCLVWNMQKDSFHVWQLKMYLQTMTNQSSDKTTNSVKAFWLKTHFFIKSVRSTGTNFLM